MIFLWSIFCQSRHHKVLDEFDIILENVNFLKIGFSGLIFILWPFLPRTIDIAQSPEKKIENFELSVRFQLSM